MGVKKRVVIVGGGAAGIFAAVIAAEKNPQLEVIVLEKTRQLLSKVKISGGGRCNVTHAQFDPKKLTAHYPRGNKELLGPFHRFQPEDTIAWFKRHGVELKTEEDGRMFPTTDHSATIINCLLDAAKASGVTIRTEHGIKAVEKNSDGYLLHLDNQESIPCNALILATGSNPQGHALAAKLGHTIISAVPSLFTFNVPSSPLLDLAGITLTDAELSFPSIPYKQRGNLLLTHWGFSGPAALKLSSWAARDLHACNYRTPLFVNWIPSIKKEALLETLQAIKRNKPSKFLENENPFPLPMNLWKRALILCSIPSGTSAGHVSDKHLRQLSEWLSSSSFAVDGKTTYKSEFVTCGGIHLKEVDFKTMESRLSKNLFFAGEVLDIDGVTGGFNFQNAWTTAYLAATAIAQSSS
jgi:predicted Rossmann fold flavoprotein